MTTLTITAKGQVTLKKSLLASLGVAPGDRLKVVDEGNQKLTITPEKRARRRTIEQLAGSLKREGQPHLTIEEMSEIIAKGWAGELAP